MTLQRVRILVVDDQRDVAVTLTSGLRDAGASLAFVADGDQAVHRIEAGGFDLVLLDMKMPPGDWGGLWALRELRERQIAVPVIVLSGEGGQRQTIEAMRLGARDWVDKGTAGRELAERCADLVADVRQGVLKTAARTLPSPVAYSFDRYASAFEHDRSVSEGLRVLEDVVKFAAVVALADRHDRGRGIPGVQATQFARPSLGTWVTTARGLVAESAPDAPAATWWAALLPERGASRQLQEMVTLRNDIAHAGKEATPAQAGLLHGWLEDVAHRLTTTWPWGFHVVTSLDYNGTAFTVHAREHVGTSGVTASSFESTSPVRTGAVVLLGPKGRTLPLAPWLEVINVDGEDAVAIYDSASLPRHDADSDAPLQYADPASRSRGLTASNPEATWSSIRHHFDRA